MELNNKSPGWSQGLKRGRDVKDDKFIGESIIMYRDESFGKIFYLLCGNVEKNFDAI